jgi:hypothetical protein
MRRSQTGDERAAKHFSKDRNRQEEARAGMDPSDAVRRQAPHRDDAVHVGMMLETLPPRVEHHEPADGRFGFAATRSSVSAAARNRRA